MLKHALVINACVTIAWCCHWIKDVEVHTILTDGVPLVIEVSDCIERKSFLDGNLTRNVVDIDINKQKVDMLGKDSVRHLLHLQKFTVRNSTLRQIDPALFRNTPLLQTIEFINNKLQHIPAGVFLYEGYKSISLLGNEISIMDDNAFFDLPILNSLSLAFNKLKIFNNSWFDELPNLKSIDFQHNEIKVIPTDAFERIKNVTHIYLNHNNIADIKSRAFEGLYSLIHLDLQYNLLKTINVEIFPRNFKIGSLNINANRLNFLKESFISGLSIRTIGIYGNPWSCPCYLSMITLLKSKNVNIESSEECYDVNLPMCAVPSINTCKTQIDENVTKKYYKKVVHQKASQCVRLPETV